MHNGLVVVLLANFKGLPFVWNIRLVSSILRHYALAFKPGPTSRPKDLYAPCMYNLGPCLPADLDFNLHKSNSTYAIDLDFARLELVFEKFRKVLTNSTHFAKTYVPLGSLSLHFIKAISPGEQVSIESRILSYDDKWLFILSRFFNQRSGQLKAMAVSRYVFKQGTKTVKPQFLIDECGFDSEHADRQTDSLQGQKIAKEILDIEATLRQHYAS